MAYGVKKLGQLQLGAESTFGTAVTPDILWRGEATEPQDESPPEFLMDNVGDLTGYDNSFIPFYEGSVEMSDVIASYEHLPHILEAGLKTVTPAADTGGGSGYYYTYPFPTTAQQAIKSYTLRGGDNNRVSQMKGSYVTGFTISGEAKGMVTVNATWSGHRPTSSSFASLTPSSTHDFIYFQNAKLYIDGVASYNAATYPAASTQITNTFLGFTLDCSGINRHEHTGDGSLDSSFVKNIGNDSTLKIVMENDGNATTELTAYRNQTPQVVSVYIEGVAITGGTLFGYKTLCIDAVGKWSEFPSPSESDGNNQVELTLTIKNNLTAGTPGRIVVVNELSALP